MKKILLIGCMAFLLVGCGEQIPKLKNGEEAVVNFEDGSMISVDELYAELKETSALQSLLSLTDKQMLEDKYKDDIEAAQADADTSFATIEQQYGDQTLQTLQMYGFTSEEAYKESTYISYLQNLAVEDYAKTLITDKEIDEYYNNTLVADIKLSQILITPNVKDGATPDEQTKAEEAALKEAEDIIKTLNDTEPDKVAETFEKLAKEKSDDKATSDNGGSMGYVNKVDLDKQYTDFGTEAYSLKDGAYSKEPFKTELGYHVLYRTETKSKPKLETVRDSIIETLTQEKITNDATVSINAMRELREEYGFEIIDTELQSQYAIYIQNALYSAEEQNKQNAAAQ